MYSISNNVRFKGVVKTTSYKYTNYQRCAILTMGSVMSSQSFVSEYALGMVSAVVATHRYWTMEDSFWDWIRLLKSRRLSRTLF